ncbi:MAG: phosphoribosylaminoimidazolesuccinocarboxamide synthase [Jatrophihabitantaceae bacterium]
MATATKPRLCPEADLLLDECADLEIDLQVEQVIARQLEVTGPAGERFVVDIAPGHAAMLEQVLQGMRFDFDALPSLVLGDSKDVRLLTPKVTLARLRPTVYSFTNNRYGTVPGTDEVRARFSAAVFRSMAESPGNRHLASAFLGLVETPVGPLLAERRVSPCNLEVRVKRFHIGSPLHRYRYTEDHSTVSGPPLRRWSRFPDPVVCFDWRNPLHGDDGERLADEPISDDYAAVWMVDPQNAKRLARDSFEWLEERFRLAGLQLIDICFFIDRGGRVVYGEISPDCMRVRSGASDDAEALDKDQWRSGAPASELLLRYRRLHELVFGSSLDSSSSANDLVSQGGRHGTDGGA